MDSSQQQVILDNTLPSGDVPVRTDQSSRATAPSSETSVSVHASSASSLLCVASVPEETSVSVPEEVSKTVASVTYLPQQDVTTNKNKCGRTVLMQHAIAGDVAAVEELVAAGVDVSEVDESGLSAIAYAAVCGHHGVVQVLLDAKAPAVVMSTGLTALVERVCGEENMDVMEVLFGVKSRLAEEEEAARRTQEEARKTEDRVISLLVWAAKSGYVDVAKLLLSAGADIQARDGQDRNALDCAVDEGHIAAVTALLVAGADVNASVKHGTSVLERLRNRRKLVNVLLDAGQEKYWSLVKAVGRHFFEGQELFLAAGVDVGTAEYREYTALREAFQALTGAPIERLLAARRGLLVTDEEGRTPLHRACLKRSLEDIQRLVMIGADMKARDKSGRTPLHAFCAGNNDTGVCGESLIYLLLATDVDVNARDNDGYTALHIALARCSVEVVKALLAAGADMNVRNSHGNTALFIAASRWNRMDSVMLKALIRAGADVDQKSANGDTLLHIAAAKDREDVLKLLLRAGADVNMKNKSGKTALYFACIYCNKVIKRLLAVGADFWTADNEGGTALHAAVVMQPKALLSVLETARICLNREAGEHNAEESARNSSYAEDVDDDDDDDVKDDLYKEFCRLCTGEAEDYAGCYNYCLEEEERHAGRREREQ